MTCSSLTVDPGFQVRVTPATPPVTVTVVAAVADRPPAFVAVSVYVVLTPGATVTEFPVTAPIP
jgi:hypothetical protein